MKVILTGASSFTGTWFAQALRQAGHEVVAPVRGSLDAYEGGRRARLDHLQSLGVRLVHGVAFGDEAFRALLTEGCDVLCHHAAEVRNYKDIQFDVAAAVNSNTFEARATLEAAKAGGCKAVVATGSVFEQDEGAGEQPLKAFSPYGLSKGLSWQVLRFWAGHVGLPIHKFVIPNPFGPFEEPRFCAYLMGKWVKGELATVGTPRYVRDNIHVSLLAVAYRRVVESSASSPAGGRCAPMGYVETQGAFAQRFAREIGGRLGLKADLALADQRDFAEPVVRVNTDLVLPADHEWTEAAAWDDLAAYYERVYRAQ